MIEIPTEDQAGDLDKLFKGENRKFAPTLMEIVDGLREFWPLTVRQVYYQAVAKLVIQNRLTEYRKVSRVLTTLRRHDLIPWGAIEDRTRRTFGKRGLPDVAAFIQGQIEGFLEGYGRCYIQEQDIYIEVATEKDALSSIMQDAVWMFCTRLSVVRGQVSATMVNQMAARFDQAIMLGKRPVLLYLGDLDPSGVAIPKALVRNMSTWHGVDVELRRVALNPDQVSHYALPVSLEAAKKSDPNYKAWLDEYGDQAPVELDALHPRDLIAVTQGALMAAYDMSQVAEQKARETEERAFLKRMKQDVEWFISRQYREVLGYA